MQILKPSFKEEMQILKPALKGEQQELDTKTKKYVLIGLHMYVWFLFWKVSRLIKKGIGLASHVHP